MVGMKQEFRQSQNLVMTQALQQSIKLLQLSAVELQEYIDEELEKNPLLSKEEEAAEDSAEPAEEGIEASGGEDEDSRVEAREVDVSDSDYSVNEELVEGAYGDEWSEGESTAISAGPQGSSGGYDDEGEGYGIESAEAHDKTLREHILEQIHMDITDAAELLIAEKLTELLDDAGYLREDTGALAEELGASKEEIEAVISKLQQMEPVGVFARSLTECLALQLKDMDRLDPIMETFLENIEMMASGDVAGLRKKCNADAEDFSQMLEDIRRCNPKPGLGFAREDVQAVIPDVIVRRAKSGGWHLELNPEAMPRVLVNKHYAADVGARKEDKEAKKFVSEQMANANWLVKALDQRANTILKVATEIVKQQDKFLVHGIRFLKPLVLKDIAAAVGMHESTISRVTTSKFMATPRGTLELKFFFTSAINAGTGANDFSSKTVQFYIKELVNAEDPKDILSDDAIVKRLKDRNIDVARRTVTKYREEMNIPSSVIRRRQKAGAAA